ncbi:hypothetical protein JR316_0009625 [Psilocybe cubensis]|uniref:Uncharacterized protein n=1 Tax=Psilocybe cubensis TaxID=181762 RepID=A0ACB8GPS8_PSICU|nr:hypothetical protein JR316_0009625 [Psilocybe cubensis]KAH9477412.1 hypothetical protein JR316_0009625 [Psilocybe cubensis]
MLKDTSSPAQKDQVNFEPYRRRLPKDHAVPDDINDLRKECFVCYNRLKQGSGDKASIACTCTKANLEKTDPSELHGSQAPPELPLDKKSLSRNNLEETSPDRSREPKLPKPLPMSTYALPKLCKICEQELTSGETCICRICVTQPSPPHFEARIERLKRGVPYTGADLNSASASVRTPSSSFMNTNAMQTISVKSQMPLQFDSITGVIRTDTSAGPLDDDASPAAASSPAHVPFVHCTHINSAAAVPEFHHNSSNDGETRFNSTTHAELGASASSDMPPSTSPTVSADIDSSFKDIQTARTVPPPRLIPMSILYRRAHSQNTARIASISDSVTTPSPFTKSAINMEGSNASRDFVPIALVDATASSSKST